VSPTIYDLLIVAVLLLAAWRGLRLGLIGGLVRLAGFALGLRVAFRFEDPLGRWLAEHTGLTATEGRIAAVLLLLMLTALAVGVAALALGDFLDRIALVGSLNRVSGALIGVALALLGLWLLTVLLLGVPPSLLPFATAVRHSETVHLVRVHSPTWSHTLRATVEHVTAGRQGPAVAPALGLPAGARLF
jgi:uncharacterized membrane protein required for colicin V production